LYSWWADQRMVFLMITGQMGKEVKRYASSPPGINWNPQDLPQRLQGSCGAVFSDLLRICNVVFPRL